MTRDFNSVPATMAETLSYGRALLGKPGRVAAVPAGPAWLGSDQPGEGPRQILDVPAFAIDRFAVTNAQFAVFMEDGGYLRKELWTAMGFEWVNAQHIRCPAFWTDDRFNSPRQPVTGVSFFEATAYAAWAHGRLPAEVEWEKAARGMDGRAFPWGDAAPTLERANFAPGFVPINRAPLPVDDFPDGDSPYGCRQMAGNVFAWCLDPFHFDTPARRQAGALLERRPSPRRVLKGGAWTTGAARLRSAARWSYTPDLRDNILGFRVAYGPLEY